MVRGNYLAFAALVIVSTVLFQQGRYKSLAYFHFDIRKREVSCSVFSVSCNCKIPKTNSNFTLICIIFFEKKASALHCWHCNSHDQNYCGDPFDTDKLDPNTRAGNYADCPKGEFGTPICIKMISTCKYFSIFP